MRNTLFLFLIFISIFVLEGYSQKEDVAIRCVYLENFVRDADKPQEKKQDEFNLDIFGTKSVFYSAYERAVREGRDSLMKMGLSANEIMNRQRDIPRTHQYFEVYKNILLQGKYVCYDKVVKLYRYEDYIPIMKWKIVNETKDILGYTCQKAVITLYGRKWLAWFTPKVPVSDGPWLLTGLPGLVLEASDMEGIFHFEAIEIKEIPSKIVSLSEKKAIKCTRNEFLNYRSKYYEDIQLGLQNITGRKLQVMGSDGKSAKGKKKNFNFFERQ